MKGALFAEGAVDASFVYDLQEKPEDATDISVDAVQITVLEAAATS